MLLLLLTVGVIVACGIGLKRCDGPVEAPVEVPVIEVAGDTLAPAQDAGHKKGNRKKTAGQRKTGSSKKASGSKKEKAAPVTRDPFSDTIPLDW